jgi:phosphatidylserine/phosphatidylglycerophosphate/cardiolipin synthase-like enzyme
MTAADPEKADLPALRKNDETMLKIDSASVHAAYLQRFNAVQAAAKPGASDNTALCKGVTVQREL